MFAGDCVHSKMWQSELLKMGFKLNTNFGFRDDSKIVIEANNWSIFIKYIHH